MRGIVRTGRTLGWMLLVALACPSLSWAKLKPQDGPPKPIEMPSLFDESPKPTTPSEQAQAASAGTVASLTSPESAKPTLRKLPPQAVAGLIALAGLCAVALVAGARLVRKHAAAAPAVAKAPAAGAPGPVLRG